MALPIEIWCMISDRLVHRFRDYRALMCTNSSLNCALSTPLWRHRAKFAAIVAELPKYVSSRSVQYHLVYNHEFVTKHRGIKYLPITRAEYDGLVHSYNMLSVRHDVYNNIFIVESVDHTRITRLRLTT